MSSSVLVLVVYHFLHEERLNELVVFFLRLRGVAHEMNVPVRTYFKEASRI